jgi:transposase InsO family protein
MVQHAERNGRAISVDVRTVTRWVGDLEKDLVIAMREGPEAARLSKPSQKRSVAHLEAMEHLNADGHVWDFMVKWRDGSISRPTFAVLQDIYSRKILGWRMAKTESSEIVRLAIRDTFETYGLPRCVTFDNGSAWINKHLTAHASSFRYVGEDKPDDSPGLMAIANVQVKFAKPGRGQSKPIERAFGDMEKYMRAEPICDGAWVGYSPDNKPENAGTHAVPEDTFHALAEQIIDQHNARLGRKTEMGQGKHSFDNVFYESLHSGRSTVREAPRTMLDLFLLSRLERKVNNRNAAITIEGTDYWHEKMGNYRQQKVSVLYNPENLAASVIILDHEGRKICEAAPQGMVAFDSVGAAAAQRAKDNAYQRHLKALQDAENIMPLHELIKRSPIKNVVTPEALKDAKVIQGPFTAKAARTPEQSQKTGTDGGNVDAEYLSNLLAGLRKKSTAKET